MKHPPSGLLRTLLRQLLIGSSLFAADVGCQHSKPVSSQAHDQTPVALTQIQGLEGDQRSMLESALCQGLVEAHSGDVTCPQGLEEAMAMARQRHLNDPRTPDGSELVHEANTIPRLVVAKVVPQGSQWLLDLNLLRRSDQTVLSHRQLKTESFDSLALQAASEARLLLLQ